MLDALSSTFILLAYTANVMPVNLTRYQCNTKAEFAEKDTFVTNRFPFLRTFDSKKVGKE